MEGLIQSSEIGTRPQLYSRGGRMAESRLTYGKEIKYLG